MIKFGILVGAILVSTTSLAQYATDTNYSENVMVIKDARIAKLEEKLAEYNVNAAKAAIVKSKAPIATSVSGIVLGPGFRLMVMSTTDRDIAMKVRSQLLQAFPEQKQYMSFQMPNTKIQMGNYVSRADADRDRKRIMAMKIVANNIYVMPATVEIKVEKTTGEENEDEPKKGKLK